MMDRWKRGKKRWGPPGDWTRDLSQECLGWTLSENHTTRPAALWWLDAYTMFQSGLYRTHESFATKKKTTKQPSWSPFSSHDFFSHWFFFFMFYISAPCRIIWFFSFIKSKYFHCKSKLWLASVDILHIKQSICISYLSSASSIVIIAIWWYL